MFPRADSQTTSSKQDHIDVSLLEDTNNKTLNDFKLDKKRSISFQFTEDESKIIQDELDRKNTPSGRSQALKRLHGQIQWRHPN